ncbi:hypothetical protein [Mucilaginibacter arboris]|uniref:Uncharacterized protein n=1 Tax=Mucilaginibacter arboris TaxID=2682090 RepID=A0A7K1T1X2_9SPHI|nr:hypothetical protein [Mucilaginibacter arboris]MVN23549.1 hypothetical protein [Mucilaginibacter arboris]
MLNLLYQTRLAYLSEIDKTAKFISEEFTSGKQISEQILKTIIDLYESAKVEQSFKGESFETAYHSPITGELEFLIARILFHYSAINNKRWKIYLRRQESKTAPDIRLLKDNKAFAIIEVKAKAGWIQPFFSSDRYQHDKNRLTNGKSLFDPDSMIENSRNQLKKYFTTFELTNNDIFLFLPTLALVHRKKYLTELPQYYSYFASTSGLPAENLILLSNNMRHDLSYKTSDLHPTDNFEKLLTKLGEK